MNRDCRCDKCVDCCQRPGWFAPGEIERAATLLNLPTDVFKKRFTKLAHLRFNEPATIRTPRVRNGWCIFFSTG